MAEHKSELSINVKLPTVTANPIVGSSTSSKSSTVMNNSILSPGQATAQMPNGIGTDTGADISDTTNKVYGQYTGPKRKQDLDENRVNQDNVTDAFTMTPEQWYKMYGYWNWDLAKNNPNGNLNNLSFESTLHQSRIADALNNKRHWKAAKIGRRTNSGFGTNEFQEGYSERWEPTETQEMRQMRVNEKLAEEARQRQVNRAENIQDYPFELQKRADQYKQQLAYYQAQTGVDVNRLMQKGIFDSEYSQSWNTYWNNYVTRFATELGLDVKDRVFQKAINLKYPFSQVYAYLHAGMNVPNPVISAAWETVQSFASQFEDPEMRAKAYALGGGWLMGPMASAVGQGFVSGLGLGGN